MKLGKNNFVVTFKTEDEVLELEQRLNVANKGIERIDEQRKN